MKRIPTVDFVGRFCDRGALSSRKIILPDALILEVVETEGSTWLVLMGLLKQELGPWWGGGSGTWVQRRETKNKESSKMIGWWGQVLRTATIPRHPLHTYQQLYPHWTKSSWCVPDNRRHPPFTPGVGNECFQGATQETQAVLGLRY